MQQLAKTTIFQQLRSIFAQNEKKKREKRRKASYAPNRRGDDGVDMLAATIHVPARRARRAPGVGTVRIS